MFDDINQAQWLWYFHNTIEDDNDTSNMFRDFVEYNASFIEPGIVKGIVDKRAAVQDGESGDDSVASNTDEEFAENIKDLFGKEINI